MHEANVVATELARKIKRWTSPWHVRLVLALGGLLLLSLLVAYRYSPKNASVECVFRIPASAVSPETKGDAHRVDTCVHLEESSSESERILGLSGRRSMTQNEGMLFDFGRPGEYCMWMKDMYLTLDMLWLDQNQEIVYMIENVTPDTYPKSFCGPKSAQYVVEVNSGIVKAADLHVGQGLRF